MSAVRSMPSEIVEFLSQPDGHCDGPALVEIKETHISLVFLTRRFAYKLKKAVRFDFLDFSTLEKRKHACDIEVQLNRRLAPSVYLNVVPVRQAKSGKLSIGGAGETVEWLVKMRRLDDAHTLSEVIAAGGPSSDQTSALGMRLAAFYIGQAPAVVKSEEFATSLMNHIAANRAELMRLMPDRSGEISAAHAAQVRFARLLRPILHDRVCDGRIVDGHGDLRPEHIYFEAEPVIIDCIEFNDEYRQNDIVDELSFLSMECDALGCGELGDSILQTYFAESGDRCEESLVSFYKCYRACVRAKVAALRGEQLSDRGDRCKDNQVNAYLDLAIRYARKLGPKLLVTVGGLMGTGKSTVASLLAEQLRAELFRTDGIRNELYARDDGVEYGEGKYSQEARDRVYSVMFGSVESSLEFNPTIILDGTFSSNDVRNAAQSIGEEAGAKWIHVECYCPKEVSIQRILKRRESERSESEARPELYDRQLADYEPCSTSSNAIRIDTTLPIEDQVDTVLRALRALATNGIPSRA